MSESYILVLSNGEKNSDNCVKWAREYVPKLPFGLWNLADKKKIINSKKAKPGNVAIINVGALVGHVAVVVWVGSNHITIKEANYKAGKITERHNTEKDLKILGYFDPNK
jgi:hypothetical protein